MEFLRFNIQRDEVDRFLREVRMNWRANGVQSQGMLEEAGGANEVRFKGSETNVHEVKFWPRKWCMEFLRSCSLYRN